MPARPFPTLTRVFSRREIKLDDQRRVRIRKALPKELGAEESQESSISEVEELLSWLEVDVRGEAELGDEIEQVRTVANTARDFHMALGALDSTARTWLLEQQPMDNLGFGRGELARDVFQLILSANRVLENFPPNRGRPTEYAEQMALERLASLWEAWTARPIAWSNSSKGGGPFGRFIEAIGSDIHPSRVRRFAKSRSQKSP